MKVILLGDTKTGKTTWVHRLNGNENVAKGTLGFEVHNVYHNGVKYEIWDTGYGGIRDAYFLGSSCAFIVYTEREQVEKYKKEIVDVMKKEIPYVAFNIHELQDIHEPFRILFGK